MMEEVRVVDDCPGYCDPNCALNVIQKFITEHFALTGLLLFGCELLFYQAHWLLLSNP